MTIFLIDLSISLFNRTKLDMLNPSPLLFQLNNTNLLILLKIVWNSSIFIHEEGKKDYFPVRISVCNSAARRRDSGSLAFMPYKTGDGINKVVPIGTLFGS